MRSLFKMCVALAVGVSVYLWAPIAKMLFHENIQRLSTGRHWSYGINRLAFLNVVRSRIREFGEDTWIFGSSIGNSLFPPSALDPSTLALYYPYGRPLVLDPWLRPNGKRWIFLIDPQMLLGPIVPAPSQCEASREAHRELWRLCVHAALPGGLGWEEETMHRTLMDRKATPDRPQRRRREISHLLKKIRARGTDSSLEADMRKLVDWSRSQSQCGGSLKVVILPVTAEFRQEEGSPVESNLRVARRVLFEGAVELLDLSGTVLSEEQLVDWGHYDGWSSSNLALRQRILD